MIAGVKLPPFRTLRLLPIRLYCRPRILTDSTVEADGLVLHQQASPPVGNWEVTPHPAPKTSLGIPF